MLMNNLAGKVMYQMSLRTMSTKGTLRACEELLPHVKSLGVDIVYVCPFFVEDDDMDKEVWSIRQKASGCENPKNPYKIADYFNIDEEYGTDEDFESFVNSLEDNIASIAQNNNLPGYRWSSITTQEYRCIRVFAQPY